MEIDPISAHLESVHPGMGANLVSDVCSFRVWAPNAVAVAVDRSKRDKF